MVELIKFMRIFLFVFILFLSLQSFTKANDIKDFELEGLSLGDSLLNFFNKKQITTEMNSGYAFFIRIISLWNWQLVLLMNILWEQI